MITRKSFLAAIVGGTVVSSHLPAAHADDPFKSMDAETDASWCEYERWYKKSLLGMLEYHAHPKTQRAIKWAEGILGAPSARGRAEERLKRISRELARQVILASTHKDFYDAYWRYANAGSRISEFNYRREEEMLNWNLRPVGHGRRRTKTLDDLRKESEVREGYRRSTAA